MDYTKRCMQAFTNQATRMKAHYNAITVSQFATNALSTDSFQFDNSYTISKSK
jgi:hypothetical protein